MVTFNNAVCLRVISCDLLEFDAQMFGDVLPDVGGEIGSSVYSSPIPGVWCAFSNFVRGNDFDVITIISW